MKISEEVSDPLSGKISFLSLIKEQLHRRPQYGSSSYPHCLRAPRFGDGTYLQHVRGEDLVRFIHLEPTHTYD
jgi:hypothetical protein